MVRLRVESYAGMIFASFNHDIEPLTDFLGPAMKWMDLFMKQGLATRCRPPPRTVFAFPATGKSSWKIPPTAITSRSSISRFKLGR